MPKLNGFFVDGKLSPALVFAALNSLEQHAYREGYETRVDVPEAERIEKAVTIKAPKRVKYGDVVKVIDVIKGAGSSPIVLQLDDLPN